jgi:acyl-CoA reductase-like NAD-dependent aldehyde dehydrogenase
MAHLLRKIAIIGLIAVNSPVHGGKPDEASLQQVAESVRSGTRGVAGSLTAAREAAEILAGMDPALRERILSAAATTMAARQAAPR